MAAQAGLLFLHRLARLSTYNQGHQIQTQVLRERPVWRRKVRTISTGSVRSSEDDSGNAPPSHPSTSPASRRATMAMRRRPLSPLERVSRLLPTEALSPEVTQLRENQGEDETEEETTLSRQRLSSTQREGRASEAPDEATSSDTNPAVAKADAETNTSWDSPGEERRTSPALHGESSITFGELLLAEYWRKGRVDFSKMFQLQTGERLHSNLGWVDHDQMAGRPVGCRVKTSRYFPLLIRRPSLEDYVLRMRRGPAIAYPKVQYGWDSVYRIFWDASAMLMMMDVGEGAHVLESGSGSGAMSLFLSRAVGAKGKVMSVEVREDHHRRAVTNYDRWRASWRLRSGEEWPDNVQFHLVDLREAASLLSGEGFHAVALDLSSPQLVLSTVTPHLHSGGVCAVYLSNITQVIDLLEGLRCLAVPLLCERIIELPVRDWLVAPARQKNGEYCLKKAPVLDEDQGQEEKRDPQTPPAFGSIPYIARPHPEQMSHTAFLVKLRKYSP